MRAIAGSGMLLATVALAVGMYVWSTHQGLAQLRAITSERLELYALAMEAELARYAYLPSLAAADPHLTATSDLIRPTDTPRERIARALARINARAGSMALMLLAADGTLLASSDPSADDTALPAAVRDAGSAQVTARSILATNTQDGSTELYIVHPIRRADEVLARLIARVSLAPLEATWVEMGMRTQSEKLLVVNDRHVVVLSSVPRWKNHSIELETVLPATWAAAMPAEHGLEALDIRAAADAQAPFWEWRLAARMGVALSTQLVQDRRIPILSARMIALLDPVDVVRNARNAAWGGAAASCAVNLLLVYLMYRRSAMRQLFRARNALQNAHDRLEREVHERTMELVQANEELQRQVARRLQTEHELLQASKMAVLGQMSAGISHEINQPLTALRALSRNTVLLLKSGAHGAIAANLQSIEAMVERMGRIVLQLTSFARKASVPDQPTELWSAVRSVLLLLAHRIEAEKVKVLVHVPSGLRVRGESNRLEQVLVNLVTNALDAMGDTTEPRLHIVAERRDGRIVTRVEDNGHGMDEGAMRVLFEPFFTTKPAGQGLGLGLVISSKIIREFGGQLRASRLDKTGGMCFEFDLLAEADAASSGTVVPPQGSLARKVSIL